MYDNRVPPIPRICNRRPAPALKRREKSHDRHVSRRETARQTTRGQKAAVADGRKDMIFITHKPKCTLVATWDPRQGCFAFIVNGRAAMTARTFGTDQCAAEFPEGRADAVIEHVRGLAQDLASMLALIARGYGFDGPPNDSEDPPQLAGWECDSCCAPMITPRVPNSIETVECPQCNQRRTATERGQIGLAIVLVQARISEAIATAQPKLAARTRSELEAGSNQFLRISALLSDNGAEAADSGVEGSPS